MPSVSRDDPAYADQKYWRGQIWPPMVLWTHAGLRRAGRKEQYITRYHDHNKADREDYVESPVVLLLARVSHRMLFSHVWNTSEPSIARSSAGYTSKDVISVPG